MEPEPEVTVWAVVRPTSLSQPLYDAALALLDPASRERVQRFYHRADACRPGPPPPPPLPRIAFNISHDAELVALAFAQEDGEQGGDAGAGPEAEAGRVGVDVMCVRAPKRETFAAFVDMVGDTLTPLEKRALLAPEPALSPRAALARFYRIWTAKEAYTKALGLGLGFDFRRVEVRFFDGGAGGDGEGGGEARRTTVSGVAVDGAPPAGWEFLTFEVEVDGEGGGNGKEATERDTYVGVVARFVGGPSSVVRPLLPSSSSPSPAHARGRLVRMEAETFLRDAVRELGG
ncbi:hypothetical protein OF83DRAFT_1084087 [Amylostereum chailletii]|nr:hypothetical protein OF83DRAFT_1084087 [Amylostereum chailletii]